MQVALMVELLKVDEGEPATWPNIPDAPANIEPAAVWRRIEHWINHRWGERSVTWFVSGPGDWLPPLWPYTIDTVQRWAGTQYETVTLETAPLGHSLDDTTYKVQA